MNYDKSFAKNEKSSLNEESVNQILATINVSNNESDIEYFIQIVYDFAYKFKEQQYLQIKEICDDFLAISNIPFHLEKRLYLIKIYVLTLINDVYQAIDTLYKLKSFHGIDDNTEFLIFLFYISICYSQGLLEEIKIANEKIIKKIDFKNIKIEYLFYYYINLIMYYSKLNSKKLVFEMEEKLQHVLLNLDSNEYRIMYELIVMSSKILLDDLPFLNTFFKTKLDWYERIIQEFDFSNSLSIVMIECHTNLLDYLIKENLLSKATSIAITLYKNSRTNFANIKFLNKLKNIFEINQDLSLVSYIEEYITLLEKQYQSSRNLFKQYLLNDKKLYEQKNYLNQIVNSYRHDSLTGCLSRAAFLEEDKLMSHGGYLIFFDLNAFKKVNDLYGHNIGDKYLITFAHFLMSTFNKNAKCYRIGGDEFIIIMRKIASKDLIKMLEDLKTNLIKHLTPYFKGDFPFSAGVCNFSKNDKLDKVLQEADKAMYYAKNIIKQSYFFVKKVKKRK